METLSCEPSSPPQHSQPSATIRIALVEDDAPVRHILCDWIRQTAGLTYVSDYPDAETALTALPGLSPDVVLIDINLPGLNGIECVRKLKLQLPKTQFVMLTVYEDSDHIFNALAAGATGYLVKRTPREALIEALKEVHAGGSPMSTTIARKVVQALHETRFQARPTEGLSPRENEVLVLLARGYMYKEISEAIGISLPTVSTYIRRIYEKLHVHSRAQAVALYAQLASGNAHQTIDSSRKR